MAFTVVDNNNEIVVALLQSECVRVHAMCAKMSTMGRFAMLSWWDLLLFCIFKPTNQPASQMTFNLCDYTPLARVSFSLLLLILLLVLLFCADVVSFSTTRVEPIFIHCILLPFYFSPSSVHTRFLIVFIDGVVHPFQIFQALHHHHHHRTTHSTLKSNFSTGKGILLHLWFAYVSRYVIASANWEFCIHSLSIDYRAGCVFILCCFVSIFGYLRVWVKKTGDKFVYSNKDFVHRIRTYIKYIAMWWSMVLGASSI